MIKHIYSNKNSNFSVTWKSKFFDSLNSTLKNKLDPISLIYVPGAGPTTQFCPLDGETTVQLPYLMQAQFQLRHFEVSSFDVECY